MRIQHNIMSMNAYRNYNNNANSLSKNLEKLSSGYKINRAGDDAAGLAISEKMRAQIKGLEAAQKNVKDGISLVKTAEGAMQEIQDMLSRMKYLATQSANGTYDDDVDRDNLQMEVDKLLDEIDRIGDNANFNGIKLLDGSQDDGSIVLKSTGTGNTNAPATKTETFGKIKATSTAGTTTTAAGFTPGTKAAGTPLTGQATGADMSGANVADVSTIKAITNLSVGGVTVDLSTLSISDNDATTDVIAAIKGAIDAAVTAANTAGAAGTGDYNKIENVAVTADGTTGFKVTFDSTPQTYAPAGTKTAASLELDFTGATGADVIGGTLTVGDKTYEFVKTGEEAQDGNVKVEVDEADVAADIVDVLKTEVDKDTTLSAKFGTTDGGDKLTIEETAAAGNTAAPAVKGEGFKADNNTTAAGGLRLQIGDTSGEAINVSIGKMHRTSMGLNGLSIADIGSAAGAIQTIKDAINYVSSVRGNLGATQNRLEHTQNNLSVMTENIQDAESTIRDTDVADEMMAYTKNNILIQSAQAMLAQANAVPQGVLQLLQ